MAISIQSLLTLTGDIYRLKLIAGKESASSAVSWMYYTEDISTIDFIRGGELVVTTGMSIGRQNDNTDTPVEKLLPEYLEKLIRGLFEQKASGLIINTGKYIGTIPEEIVELCDRLQFPLLTMPWQIHIIDIMQDYGNRIVQDQQKGQKLEQTVYNAMFNPKEFNIVQFEGTSFADAENYSIVLMEIPEELTDKDDEEFLRYMNYSFNRHIELNATEYCMLLHDKKVVYVFHSEGLEKAKKIEKAARRDKYFARVRIAVSGTCTVARHLEAEYRHAELAFMLCPENSLLNDYEDLGIYKLLGEIQEKRVLQKFYDSVLGGLKDFSEDKLNDYLNTLELYLKTSGKVQKAAEENSTHRNTVNYRIKKICDTLNIDLQDGETRYRIQTALYIRNLMKKY